MEIGEPIAEVAAELGEGEAKTWKIPGPIASVGGLL
jgi:hypothetical protein